MTNHDVITTNDTTSEWSFVIYKTLIFSGLSSYHETQYILAIIGEWTYRPVPGILPGGYPSLSIIQKFDSYFGEIWRRDPRVGIIKQGMITTTC